MTTLYGRFIVSLILRIVFPPLHSLLPCRLLHHIRLVVRRCFSCFPADSMFSLVHACSIFCFMPLPNFKAIHTRIFLVFLLLFSPPTLHSLARFSSILCFFHCLHCFAPSFHYPSFTVLSLSVRFVQSAPSLCHGSCLSFFRPGSGTSLRVHSLFCSPHPLLLCT